MGRRDVKPPKELGKPQGKVMIQIGGVPYPGFNMGGGEITRKNDQGESVKYADSLLWLTEDVGKEDEYGKTEAEFYFAAGAYPGRLIGTHETTGLPLYEIVPLKTPPGWKQ